MEKCLLFAMVLLSTVVLESAATSHQELSESEGEVIYRVARGIRERKKSAFFKGGECRYKKGPWEECDSASNTERRTLTLKRGDSTCEQTKVLSRKCKKACKYEKGDWNECEKSTNMRTRTDTLKPKSDSSCDPTRTISKKCKKACRYNKETSWTECDPNTGKKIKILVLVGGDPDVCEPNKKITKQCRGGRKGGKGKFEEDDYDDEE